MEGLRSLPRSRRLRSAIPMRLKIFARMALSALLGLSALSALGVEFARSQSLSQPVNKDVAAALVLEQRAVEAAAKGNLVEAEGLYKLSLNTIEANMPGDPVLAGSLNNLGQFYRTHR